MAKLFWAVFLAAMIAVAAAPNARGEILHTHETAEAGKPLSLEILTGEKAEETAHADAHVNWFFHGKITLVAAVVILGGTAVIVIKKKRKNEKTQQNN